MLVDTIHRNADQTQVLNLSFRSFNGVRGGIGGATRKGGEAASVGEFDHIWWWRANEFRRIDRKGQRCRVLIRGAKNSVLVEFEDGFKTVTSRYAVRKAS